MNHLGTQTIETSRLILRRYEMSDAEDIFRNWVTDPEVSRFWGWEPHKHIGETRKLLTGWIEEYENPFAYHWVIVLKSVSEAIGYIYFNDIDNDGESVSVHYLLSRIYWNQGFASEACQSVLMFAFSKLGAKKVHSRHHVDNPASGRVLQKCGMRHVKTAFLHVPDCEQISGNYCYYEITTDAFDNTDSRS